MDYTDTRTNAEKAADLELSQIRFELASDPEMDAVGHLEDRLARLYRDFYDLQST
jgi:hypothetical protein